MSAEAPPAPTTSVDAPRLPPPEDPPSHRRCRSAGAGLRPRRRIRFGIQSKLLIMLLATSILSALVVGFVGYTSGKNALQDSEFDRLTQVRESGPGKSPPSSIS